MLVYFPFIYFSALFLYKWKSCKTLNVGGAILLLYAISSFFSIVLKESNYWPHGHFPELTLLPTLIYCGLLTLTILPFYNFKLDESVPVMDIDNKTFKIVSWLLISLSLVFIVVNFEGIIDSLRYGFLSMGFNDIRGDFYDEAADGVSHTRFNLSAAQYFINFSVVFSPLLLLFFFYSITFLHNSVLFNSSLILSSLVIVLYSTMNASRTQSFYWVITVILLYILFRPCMKPKLRRIINMSLIIIILLVGIYFAAVTLSRAQEKEFGAQGFLVYYMGQSYPHFVNVFQHFTFDGITIDRLFPITSKYLLGNYFDITQYRSMVETRIGAPVAIFYTFLGDALIDFGFVGMFIYAIVFSLICRNYFLANNSICKLSSLVIYILLLRQISLGIFAYVYLSIPSSVLIIGSIIIAEVLKRKTIYNNINIMYKN